MLRFPPRYSLIAALAALACLLADAALAQTPPTPDKGDTTWMMTSSVLVLLMTIPGLALFYAGNNGNTISLFGANPYRADHREPFQRRGPLCVYDSTVPEPATLLLVGAGIAGLIRNRRAARRN